MKRAATRQRNDIAWPMRRQRPGYCAILVCSWVLSACSSPEPMITGPLSVQPAYPVTNIENNGAIFHASSSALFENSRPQTVGDIIRIDISETLNGSNKASTTNTRDTSLKQVGPGTGANSSLSGLLSSIFNINATATGSDSFKGSGQTDNSQTMTGTLMVTIIETFPNGNLKVAGEKRIGMNNSVNILRFTGIVRSGDIHNGAVASSNVADARIEQVGGGPVSDANTETGAQQFFHGILNFW